ncbi:Uncharacterised protein [Suttonella ornithocola]|uniref:Uncharacterized protein n=1 Tax=Suttonella ornithocola TaxID=279832 RepID=A0A380RC58_9GAMM|nr:Uncharacterised protein [Suttonella ornithocola]
MNEELDNLLCEKYPKILLFVMMKILVCQEGLNVVRDGLI